MRETATAASGSSSKMFRTLSMESDVSARSSGVIFALRGAGGGLKEQRRDTFFGVTGGVDSKSESDSCDSVLRSCSGGGDPGLRVAAVEAVLLRARPQGQSA